MLREVCSFEGECDEMRPGEATGPEAGGDVVGRPAGVQVYKRNCQGVCRGEDLITPPSYIYMTLT